MCYIDGPKESGLPVFTSLRSPSVNVKWTCN